MVFVCLDIVSLAFDLYNDWLWKARNIPQAARDFHAFLQFRDIPSAWVTIQTWKSIWCFLNSWYEEPNFNFIHLKTS